MNNKEYLAVRKSAVDAALERYFSVRAELRTRNMMHAFESGFILAYDAAYSKDDEPIPMLLFCPNCRKQHIDVAHQGRLNLVTGRPTPPWTNPPHHKHLCDYCGFLWQPSLRNTTGVETL